jgi:hypothetical protein
MSNNPLNLTVRFFLELFGLFCLGYWGWTQHAGFARPLLAFGVPLIAAVLWGVFRVPGDPGDAPVAVPGFVRLLLEAAFFGSATWALFAAGRPTWGWVFGGVVLVHYIISYDRILRFLKYHPR